MNELMLLVGHLPRTRRGENLRRVLRETLGEHPYLCLELVDGVDRPDNVRPLIDMAFVCLFDVSRSRDVGAFLDLGYALGRGKFCVVLRGPRSAPTTGFSGDVHVDYRSLRVLRRVIEESAIEWIAGAIRKYTIEGDVFANMDARLMTQLGASLLEGDLGDAFTTATAHGFSEEQVETTLAILGDFAMVRETDEGWALTEVGRECLPRLVAAMGS